MNKKTHHHGTELVLWFILLYNSLKIICHTFGTFWFALRHNFLGVCSALQIICVVLFIPGYPTNPRTALKSYLRRWDLLFKWGNDCVHLSSSLSFASKHKLVVIIVDDQLCFCWLSCHPKSKKPKHKLCHRYSFDNLFLLLSIEWHSKSC